MSSLIESYKYKSYSFAIPPGCIMQYYGTTDPDGWIICDGESRIVSDGRFNELSVILGNGNSNSITPPNFNNKFLSGAQTVTTIKITGGSNGKSLTTNNLPSHNHTISISDPKHSHSISASQTEHSHTVTITDPKHSHSISASQTEHNHTVTITDPGHTHTASLSQTAHSHTVTINDADVVHNHMQKAFTQGQGHLGGDEGINGVYKQSSYEGSRLQGMNHSDYSHTGVTASTNSLSPPITASMDSKTTGITIDTESKTPGITANSASNTTGITSSSDSQTPNISASSASSTTGITASSTSVGNGSEFDIKPPYYGIKYIIKY